MQLKAAQILGRTDPNASLKRGLVLWTYGKNKEAEDTTRAGMMTGNLADPERSPSATPLVEEKKQDAIAAFNDPQARFGSAVVGQITLSIDCALCVPPRLAINSRRPESHNGLADEIVYLADPILDLCAIFSLSMVSRPG